MAWGDVGTGTFSGRDGVVAPYIKGIFTSINENNRLSFVAKKVWEALAWADRRCST